MGSREPYEATNRWTEYGPNLFRLHDRRGNDYLLAPTHEEMFTLVVKDLYSSYKDLPLSLYQIQTKYRDEARSRAGLLRGRALVMKDPYSLDIDDIGLKKSDQSHPDAYVKCSNLPGLEDDKLHDTHGSTRPPARAELRGRGRTSSSSAPSASRNCRCGLSSAPLSSPRSCNAASTSDSVPVTRMSPGSNSARSCNT